MGLLKRTAAILMLTSGLPGAAAVSVYDPKLCYFLDAFLAVYGLLVTGMFIKEKFFTFVPEMPKEEGIYTDLKGQDEGGYAPLHLARDTEAGRRTAGDDEDTYTALKPHREDEYKELPLKKERRRNKEQVYQGLSEVHEDTYDKLQMQSLPPH